MFVISNSYARLLWDEIFWVRRKLNSRVICQHTSLVPIILTDLEMNKKSLYGLKQASRNFFSIFSTILQKAGYIQSKANYSLFTKSKGNSFTAVLIYEDDILLIGNDFKEIQHLKTSLLEKFLIKDLGNLKYFLDIEFSRSWKEIFMSKTKYTLEIL